MPTQNLGQWDRHALLSFLRHERESLLRRMAEKDPASSVRRRAGLALAASGVAIDDEPAGKPEVSPLVGSVFEEDPVVVLETSKGEIAIRCLADEAPVHVARVLATSVLPTPGSPSRKSGRCSDMLRKSAVASPSPGR